MSARLAKGFAMLRLPVAAPKSLVACAWLTVVVTITVAAPGQDAPRRDFENLPANTWVKLSPLADTPPSPRLGYEGACVWDSRHQVLIRYGGHNQGGGGEQGSEIWIFDPRTARWTLKDPNTSPPGICCGQQNVFDPIVGRYVRFPAFSASHGWQWRREVYLNDASVWTYDLSENRWRNMRPLPTAHPRPLRCAAWDAEHQVIVVFGGEGSHEGTWVYDPWQNTWTRMNPKPEPAPRSGGNMAYDARHKVHVLFGAQFDDDPHTWIYDLATNTWRDAQPPSMPPTDKNDAVLTYDSAAGVVLAIVKITDGKDDNANHRLETWSYDVGQNRWRKMDPAREPDPTGNRARQFLFAPELGVALLENRPSNSSGGPEQQILAYRFPRGTEEREAPLPAPTDLAVSTRRGSAVLTWRWPQDDRVASCEIYRGAAERPWEVRFAKVATVERGTPSHEDSELAPGKTYYYLVRAVDRSGRQGPPSLKVRVQPRAVGDVVVSVLDAHRVEISWKPALGGDIAGYTVERAPVAVLSDDQLKRLKAQTPPLETPSVGAIARVGPFETITASPVREPTFVDTTIDLTRRTAISEPIEERRFNDEEFDAAGREYRLAVFAYRVRSVNDLGVQSGPSPAVLTIPSSPPYVFAKEEGAACHLKWHANPERGIRGYRVYRMDGRYDKDPVSRLTAEPLTDTSYTDPTAGKSTRRYYVVAVDALGQEGFPSSPAWFDREWKSFYRPFVGEWHQ